MATVQPQADIPPPPAFTVHDAMVTCGVNDENVFDGDTPAERIAADLFGEDFATCMDKGFVERELQECPHVVMMSPTSWNPQEVSLSSATTLPTESLPTSRISHISRVGSVTRYEYLDPTSDEALLHSINPSLINLKEQMSNRTINQTMTYDKDLEDVLARRTFVSNERHSKITADLLAERFGIGPERAKATLRALPHNGDSDRQYYQSDDDTGQIGRSTSNDSRESSRRTLYGPPRNH
jgi:hypothetical protein